jgi:hypothetical protein
MAALREPLHEPRLRSGKIGVGDAGRLEPELPGPPFYLARENCRIHVARY